MDKTKSTVHNNRTQKPVNIFYVWYSELCRRINLNPAAFFKPTKSSYHTVLDFVADRLKVEEWNPIIQALRQDTSLHVISIKSRIGNCQFLHDVDTEEKAVTMKRKYGSIWTAFILNQLVKSLSCTLRNTDVLTYLELDGLPMFMHYLEPLLQALKRNKTIKTLSFSNSSIEDVGCQMVCNYLRFAPNVEVLNLSGCCLNAVSGQHIAKLIKYQQINRYCESWHNSLRYENPEASSMRGIKRITLNCNENVGDEGLSLILDELEDDLWVKALDMQRCGITETMANKILDVIQYNRTLEIVDLRQNDQLNITTIETVLHLLRQRQEIDGQAEYQWCNTASTVSWASIPQNASKITIAPSRKYLFKPKEVGSKTSTTVTWDQQLRKTKTIDAIPNKTNKKSIFTVNNKNSLDKVVELNSKLQKEIERRKEIEKKNEELRRKLDKITSSTNTKCQQQLSVTENKQQQTCNSSSSSNNNNAKAKNRTVMNVIKKALPQRNAHPKEIKGDNQPVQRNGVVKLSLQPKNGFHKINGVKNGCSKNGVVSLNSAYNIFERLLSKGNLIEEKIDHDLLSFVKDEKGVNKIYDNSKKFVNSNVDESSSQLSLQHYLDQLVNE